jgi:hypothetical protein
MTSQDSIKGSCLCQSVQYSITGNDKGAVLCHCNNCQKTTGSAFANNYRYTRAQITITSGKDTIKAYEDSNTLSGNVLTRWFCSNCGSPIYLVNEKFKGLIILYTGALDGTTQHTKPSAELFAKNRRHWFPGVDGASRL